MLKNLLFIFGILIILIVGAIGSGIGKNVSKTLFGPKKPTHQEIEDKLIEGFEKGARNINQNGPTMVDKDTRMDRATVGHGPRITYHYTFPKYASVDLDVSGLAKKLRPIVKKNVGNNEDMRPSLQYGAAYAYSYSGNDGVTVLNLEINWKDCGLQKVMP